MHDGVGSRIDQPGGRINMIAEAGGYVLHLCGDFDSPVVDKLNGDESLTGVRIIAIDVGELHFIDSSGLTFLVRWALDAREDGRLPEIRHTTHRFNRVLEITGLGQVFVVT